MSSYSYTRGEIGHFIYHSPLRHLQVAWGDCVESRFLVSEELTLVLVLRECNFDIIKM